MTKPIPWKQITWSSTVRGFVHYGASVLAFPTLVAWFILVFTAAVSLEVIVRTPFGFSEYSWSVASLFFPASTEWGPTTLTGAAATAYFLDAVSRFFWWGTIGVLAVAWLCKRFLRLDLAGVVFASARRVALLSAACFTGTALLNNLGAAIHPAQTIWIPGVGFLIALVLFVTLTLWAYGCYRVAAWLAQRAAKRD